MVKSKTQKTPASGKKRESPKKAWCFTLNNPTITKEDLQGKLAPHCHYVVIGDEVGESGTPHLQGYLELHKKQRLAPVKLLFAPHNPHLEPKSPNSLPIQASEYCKKEGKYVEFGTAPKDRKRSKILDQMCKDLIEKKPLDDVMMLDPATYVRNYRGLQDFESRVNKPPNVRPMQCYFFYGPTGVGKTYYCYEKWPDLYRKPLGGKSALWMDGLLPSHRTILFDEHTGQYPLHEMLQLMDQYALQVERKGGFVKCFFELMLFTGNIHPSLFYLKWEGREEHLRAYARRFTKVFYWPTRNRDSMLVIEQKDDILEFFLDLDNSRKVFGD